MGASSTRKEIRKRKFGTSRPLGTFVNSKEIEVTSIPSPSCDAKTEEEKEPVDSPADAADDPQDSRTRHRFVVFVGKPASLARITTKNTTDAFVQQHFASLKPISIRHLHDKTSGKSKGYAFLEFSQYDRMKTCLKTFHQSNFDDNISPPRLLNVELTAGGGGSKSKDRRVKLKVKNERLRQERERRAAELAKSQGESVTAPKPSREKGPAREQRENQDIHPSRRARVGTSK
ncbi:MAG: hypothetical protein Q9169_005249 [Polycauliona sp. 2 TL-2023]